MVFFLTGLESDADHDEVEEFNQLHVRFGELRCQVLGVVKATAREVREFCDDRGITVPLLADAGGEMIRDFDAHTPEGRARRVTVVADRHGTVVRVEDPAPPNGHAEAMLEVVRAVREGSLPDPEEAAPESPS